MQESQDPSLDPGKEFSVEYQQKNLNLYRFKKKNYIYKKNDSEQKINAQHGMTSLN